MYKALLILCSLPCNSLPSVVFKDLLSLHRPRKLFEFMSEIVKIKEMRIQVCCLFAVSFTCVAEILLLEYCILLSVEMVI